MGVENVRVTRILWVVPASLGVALWIVSGVLGPGVAVMCHVEVGSDWLLGLKRRSSVGAGLVINKILLRKHLHVICLHVKPVNGGPGKLGLSL